MQEPLRGTLEYLPEYSVFKAPLRQLHYGKLPSIQASFEGALPHLTLSKRVSDMPDSGSTKVTLQTLPNVLSNDTKVKVAGVDIDGMLRGKLMSKKKFLSIAKDGFGFCSVIYGWDMHDQTYFKELAISNAENGYRDIIAIPDLTSFRRIPWEDNVPFFLVSFFDPDTGGPLLACPRGLLKTACDKVEESGFGAMAGG